MVALVIRFWPIFEVNVWAVIEILLVKMDIIKRHKKRVKI